MSHATPRTFHIVGIENIAWDAPRSLDTQRCRDCWQAYREAVALQPEDGVLLGCCRATALCVGLGIPTGRQFVVGHNGPDGADQAILAAVDLDHIARRYQRVVIASGDAAFTWVAQALRERGLLVYNVTGTHASQSRRLREACHVSSHLSETGPHASVA